MYHSQPVRRTAKARNVDVAFYAFTPVKRMIDTTNNAFHLNAHVQKGSGSKITPYFQSNCKEVFTCSCELLAHHPHNSGVDSHPGRRQDVSMMHKSGKLLEGAYLRN